MYPCKLVNFAWVTAGGPDWFLTGNQMVPLQPAFSFPICHLGLPLPFHPNLCPPGSPVSEVAQGMLKLDALLQKLIRAWTGQPSGLTGGPNLGVKR